MALAPGEAFGRYTIVGTLGIGGMGQVLRAIDNVLERTVALKIIRADKAEREEAVARFFREARLAAQLTHPNTVQIYDLGEVDDVPFIAMEYIDGQTLSQYCNDAPADAPRKLRWLLAAARGLAAAHKRGMVHRDVKPANIMVSDDDFVKVVDFGLAKRAPTTAALRATFHTDLGFVVGTPVFMAPEQLAGSELDARSDQFSWGLTAYTLLCGGNPRRSDPLLLDPIPPIDERVPTVSAAAGAVIMRALRNDRAARYASMDALVVELDDALQTASGRLLVTIAENTLVTTDGLPVPHDGAQAALDEPPHREIRLAIHPLAALAPRRLDQRIPLAEQLPHAVGRAARPVAIAASDDATWRFERRADACPLSPLRVAAVSRNGKRIVAFGDAGATIHERGGWRPYALPSWVDPRLVRCLAVLDDGSVIVGGREALAGRISPTGNHERWSVDAEWARMQLRGLEVTDEGWVTFVGRHGSTGGVFAWPRRGALAVVAAPCPLHAVATVAHGRQQLACGPRGAIASTGWSTGSHTTFEAELRSLVPFGDGALVVGSGGHAFYVNGSLETTLDAVDTVSNLNVVTLTDAGTPWAASAKGRIVRRRRDGAKWVRLSPDFEVEPDLIALWASEDRVRAVATDGSLVQGWRRP